MSNRSGSGRPSEAGRWHKEDRGLVALDAFEHILTLGLEGCILLSTMAIQCVMQHLSPPAAGQGGHGLRAWCVGVTLLEESCS